MTPLEFWRIAHFPRRRGSLVETAVRAEGDGWSGIGIADSHKMGGDPFVGMSVAAQVTTTLKVAVNVTNPVTRHPAVMANAAATVQSESGGRAVLGIGRGDSATAYLGLAPAPVPVLDDYLVRLQAYLRGETLPFQDEGRGLRRADAQAGTGPRGSLILPPAADDPKVPVFVAGSGPKVIACGAARADELALAVGATPERVRWATGIAREARVAAGLPEDGLVYALNLPIVVHPDRATARDLMRGAVASIARYAVMNGRVIGPVSDAQRVVLERLHAVYDVTQHFRGGSPQTEVLTDDVIDTFGIAGPSSYCAERVSALVEAGVRKVFVIASGYGMDPEQYQASLNRLITEVKPAISG